MLSTETPAEPSATNAIPSLPARAKRLKQFCRDWSMSKTKAYELIQQGRLRAVKVACRTMVLAEDEQRFAESLPAIGK